MILQNVVPQVDAELSADNVEFYGLGGVSVRAARQF
jgi:hypothetical protein